MVSYSKPITNIKFPQENSKMTSLQTKDHIVETSNPTCGQDNLAFEKKHVSLNTVCVIVT